MVAIVTGRWQAYESAVVRKGKQGETSLVSFPSATGKEETEQRSRRSDLLKLILSRHSHPERDVGAQDASSDCREAGCHNGVEF